MAINIENSRRRDPTTKLVHLGRVINFGDSDGRSWVPYCKRSPCDYTAFWETCIALDVPTSCLTCMLQEERLV
jgi:hypothetical protein